MRDRKQNAAAAEDLGDHRGPSAGGGAAAAQTDPSERARLLAEVIADQARKQQVRDAKEPPRHRSQLPYILLPVLATFSSYLWFFSPSWIAPEPPPAATAEHEEASIRFAIYLQAQRIESFRTERGRLPTVLEEAGEPLPGIEYERLDARSYKLQGTGPQTQLSYVSSEPLNEFVGDAANRLQIGADL